jgi:CHAT domain-containing protein
LESQYPEYFNLKFNTVSPTTTQIENLLDKKTALVSYFIDDTNNRLYTFVITKKKFHIEDHQLPENFDRYITGFRNGLYFNDIKTYQLAAFQLGEILIPTIPRGISELVILPTGRLGIIPFEALLTKEAEENQSYSTLNYLLNQYSIRYEFSAGLIIQKGSLQENRENPAIYLCAPVTFVEDGLPDLPGTETEVKAIAKLFNDKKLKSSVYLNDDAKESTIKDEGLSSYAYLHFATHGIVDELSPELSRIYLQPDAGAEDGKLYTGEIYNLKLNANLVTLSACETGLGKISKGEGVIGLSRALVYAGAKSMIVSFWSVADESTSKLMQDFYSRMLGDRTLNFADNLRASKKQLLAGEYAAPYYWAPFVLLGY